MLPLLATLLALLNFADCAYNGRPIIAVLAQEINATTLDKTYIPASYVKALEAAGARVVPLFIRQDEKYYRDNMAFINGVVFPGGAANLTMKGGFAEAANIIYKIAKEINENSKNTQVFPILGVCQGLEVISVIAANMTNPLVDCKAENINLPLKFKQNHQFSRLYRNLSPEIDYLLGRVPVTVNHHHFCLTEPNLSSYGLDLDWRVLSTNLDQEGLEFVSSMEHKALPFVGVQFHPEKPAYEWHPIQHNPHNFKAILANRYFYDWLVNTAKQNDHRYPDKNSEKDALIYNYRATYTPDSYDLQYYYFEST
ncbi:gamma-glutamyl hydrolase A-like isoform X2 [Nilaparvata lugens]|nr:gamma-glutamyl hydrolase A-like isoform X2 [Nilaparvata lugens]XP_039296747.1 gamma-glutamyl hydrolase A-like isoform X2 [Nilaparvata lugens]